MRGCEILEDEHKITGIKPIRPTVIEFETREEYDKFIEWATNREPDNSIGAQEMRERLKNHKRAKMREDYY